MKPHRGKRVEPHRRPGEFSPASGGPRLVAIRLGRGRLCGSPRAGCTFPGAARHDRLGGGQEPGWKVARVRPLRRRENLQTAEVGPPSDRGRRRA